ncbi:GGDEF domain-containing protein [Ferrimonas balearica]|uniref:GGDEF domain-containing protein n=1 Tax=Ferrimonas balearica TaxID=44012 RepID=UPI001C99BFFA|nr:GGDEF domain-containing protein [Ferrimonas balearica]MBY5992834.1 GGDEF domain-containing protein [Ferrimonas balearica]
MPVDHTLKMDTLSWLQLLPEPAVVHDGHGVLAANPLAEPLLLQGEVINRLRQVDGEGRTTYRSPNGQLKLSIASSRLPTGQAWLSLLTAFPEQGYEHYRQLVELNPCAFMVHRRFKPLFTNPAFAKLFAFDSVEQVLALESLRSIIGEEHWPEAQRNYDCLMNEGSLNKIQVVEHFTLNGRSLHAQLVDFVLMWDGEPAVCTVVSNVSQEVQRLEHLKTLALTDSLTGLSNRRHFFEYSEPYVARAVEQGHDLALLVLDIDHFKRINDRYGHPFGDQVLRKLGGRLVDLVEDEALVARLGGEEFALLMPLRPGQPVAELAHCLCRQIRWYESYQDHQVAVEVSLGATSWQGPGDRLMAMYLRADKALYQAKANGRNRSHTHGERRPSPANEAAVEARIAG